MVTAVLERAPALHPAERRRMAALLPPEPVHDVALRPLGGGDGRALITSAREENFLPAIFADLQAPDWQARLASRRGIRRGSDQILELGLPTHRHFQIVLMEAVCRVPGFPPVAPSKLAGMGLVLRRHESGGELRGWMKSGDQSQGWLHAAASITANPEPDPDPAMRLPNTASASGQLAQLLATRRGGATPFAEQLVPLFVAPPEVCAALGRTVVYGIVPVATSDKAGTGAVPDFNDLQPDDAKAIVDHLSEYLKTRSKLPMPQAQKLLDPAWHVMQVPSPTTVLPAAVVADWPRLNALGILLQQLMVEFGAFDGSPAGNALLAEFSRLSLPMEKDGNGRVTRSMAASDFVRAAAAILIGGDANSQGLTMPIEWPAVDAAAGARLTSLARSCLTARFRQIITETPKFDRDEALYTVRAFVRVTGHAHCAPALVWSPYSEVFRILPWWDSDGPAARISLPKVSQLKKVKPNVSFEMPPQLANLLQGDMKKLKDGDGQTSDLGIGWICSFSIPIITICAFICLNIFLSLFDIIFFWMAFLKICIPYPKPK